MAMAFSKRHVLGMLAVVIMFFCMFQLFRVPTAGTAVAPVPSGIRAAPDLDASVRDSLGSLREDMNRNFDGLIAELRALRTQIASSAGSSRGVAPETSAVGLPARAQERAPVENARSPILSPQSAAKIRQIQALASLRCVDTNLDYPNNSLRLYSCHGGEQGAQNQYFWAARDGRIRHSSGRCIDAPTSAPGGQIIFAVCSQSKTQYWRRVQVPGRLFAQYRNVGNDMCMDLEPATTTLIVNPCSHACSQFWNATHVEDEPIPDTSEVAPVTSLGPLPLAGKILCWVLTQPSAHASKAVAVNNTWGRECDHLLFVSSSDYPGLNMLVLDVGAEEARTLIWPKVQQAWTHVFQTYLDKADWFIKADDDTYFVMPYLRQFLSQFKPSDPHQFGRRFFFGGVNSSTTIYNSGGAGVILSRETVRVLGERASANPNVWVGDPGGPEDLSLSQTLAQWNILPEDTRDPDGRHRFLTLGIENERQQTRSPAMWFWNFSFDALETTSCCSQRWISTHYIPPALVCLCGLVCVCIRCIVLHVHPSGKASPMPAVCPDAVP
eukprot:m.78191 g.78191  ORF g.78191 m.78191 type:complete len:552 (+) comp7954_c0_seq4:101-1756(+)